MVASEIAGNIGRVIARERSMEGWTRMELAHEAGLGSLGTVRNVESGRMPSVWTLVRLCEALDLDIRDTIEGL